MTFAGSIGKSVGQNLGRPLGEAILAKPGLPALPAPPLSLAVAGDTYPPELTVDLSSDEYQEGQTVYLEGASDELFTSITLTASNAIDAAEIVAEEATFTGLSSIVSPTETFFRANVNGGTWSNTVKHGDVVAPTITSSLTPSAPERAPLAYTPTANESVTWDITGGADVLLVEYVGGVVRLVDDADLNFETKSSYVFDLEATDLAGLQTTETVTLSVTDVDEIADQFTFTDVNDQAVSSVITSNTVTLAGLASGVSMPIVLTGSGEMSIDGGSYGTADGEGTNGTTITVRHTSSASELTGTDTTITVGTVSDTFTSTTLTTAPTPPAFANLLVWLDAADLDTLKQNTAASTAVTASGDSVGSWASKATPDYRFVAGDDSTRRPVYDLTSGIHSVQADGSNDYMYLVDDVDAEFGLGLFDLSSWCIVMASNSNPAADARMFSEGSTATGTPIMATVQSRSGLADDMGTYIRNDAGSALAVVETVDDAFLGTANVLMVEYDGTNITGYEDGVAKTVSAFTPSGAMTTNRTSLFALLRSAASNYFQGDISTFLVYNRDLTSGEKDDANEFAGDTIGLSL